MKKIEVAAERQSANQGQLLPEAFYDALTSSLEVHILSPMGEVRKTKLVRFANRLCVIAQYVTNLRDHLAFERKAVQTVRKSRVQSGRGRKKIQHALNSLRDAEAIGFGMEELRPGLLNFQPAREALERLEKSFGQLEATAAAVIHPSLRINKEPSLSAQTPYRLTHPNFKATPKSSQVMHKSVELLDAEIQRFTTDKVPSHHINQFIFEFLKSLGWTLTVANVKTIRKRFRDRTAKTSADLSSSPVRQ